MPGFDGLRIGAIVLVLWQHMMSLSGNDWAANIGPVNLGQLGVALFLALSTTLSSANRRQAGDWLWRRLVRIYPAYWVVMLVSFAGAIVTGYKAVTVPLFVSQMAGTGLFTHPGSLVNVPTWFISLLLLCYVMGFLMKLLDVELVVAASLTVSIAVLVGLQILQWPWGHLLTFAGVAFISRAAPRSWLSVAYVTSGLVCVCFTPLSPFFAYSGIALLALGLAILVERIPDLARIFADHTYEFYLVHGVSLVAALRLMRGSVMLGLVLGCSIAVCATAILRRASQSISLMAAGRSVPVRTV